MNVYCLDGDRLQMKGLFITFLGVSVWLISSLVAGTAVDAAMLPPLEAPDAVSVGVQPSGLVNKGVLTSVTGASAARQMLSISEDITTSVVSCLGNSITSGYPYSGTENTYPAQLQEMLDVAYGPESFQVINHGVDGYRADQVLADLQNLDWLAQDPDFALLLIGTNDLKDEAGWDPAQLPAVISQTVTEVQDIVNVVTAHTNADGAHPQIIVSAIIPTQDISETQAVSSYNSSLESNLTGMDLWITSNWDDFYDPATQTARASLMYDNFHPNEAGYLVMAEDWFEAINSLPVRAAGGSAMWPGGTDTLTRTRFITVYAPVQVAFVASPTTGVAPLMVAFTNASTGDYTASLWGFGDGVTSTQTSLTHTYTAGGAYTVTLTVSGPGGSGTETRIDYIIVQEEYLAYLPLTLRGG